MPSNATVARAVVAVLRASRDALRSLATATDDGTRTLSVLADETFRLARTAAFWIAVFMPLVFLWLLFQRSPVLSDPVAVLKLVTVNAAALVAGHGHGKPRHRRE